MELREDAKQVEAWQKSELTGVTAKVVIYEAFVKGKLEAPKHLARTVHDMYFESRHRNSGRGPSGVSPTRSLLQSKNWSRSRNSRRQQSWASSWRVGSHNRSSLPGVLGGPPQLVRTGQWRILPGWRSRNR
jgi:hypothetical protein